LISLIRKYRPDVVTAFLPWGHYDRNPDHRKVSRAVGEAVWMSGYANVHPEHAAAGLKPYRVPYKFYSFRSDYGKGYQPNVAVELTEDQVARKGRAYRLHRIRVSAGAARGIRAALDARGLMIPELEGLSDEDAHRQLQEWFMQSYSAEKGRENGAQFAEVFQFRDEWSHLPGLEDYIRNNAVSR
jgi:LmbE family N-acetylglucosaminyl deacetylase